MKNHAKKLVAPIIATCIISLLILGYFAVFLFAESIPVIVRLLGSVISLSLLGVAIYVLVERIKEVKGGEEDDISKY